MIRKLCERLAKYLPHFTIPDSEGKPYLTRYYLFGKDRKFCNIFLHHFHSSDKDADPDGTLLLHNHPWPWSFGLILVGGYSEERCTSVGDMDDHRRIVTRKEYRPGSINFISHKIFHRVDLLEKDGWSLFFTGWRSSKRGWGFWNRRTNWYRDFTTMEKAIE